MSGQQNHVCPYCQRANFKSARGLQQHLGKNPACRDAHHAALSSNANQRREEELARTRKCLAFGQQRTTRSRSSAQLHADTRLRWHHDMDAGKPALARDPQITIEAPETLRNAQNTEQDGTETEEDTGDLWAQRDNDSDAAEANDIGLSDEEAGSHQQTQWC